MTDTMPKDLIFIDPPKIGNKTYSKLALDHDVIPYRLKSSVDAERAADSKTIVALAGALEEIKEITKNVTDLRTFNLIRIDRFAKHALSDSAPRIAEAKESHK